jgi:hypothetical protein
MRRNLIIAAVALLIVIGLAMAAYAYFPRGARVAVAPEGSASLPVAGKTPSAGNASGTSGAPQTIPGTPVTVSAWLVKISAGPVVPGVAVVNRGAASASSTPEVAVNYIERQSGNVFSYLVRAKTLSRTSNRTIPGIQSAAWLPNGTTAFVRYLSGTNSETVNTYALRANGSDGFFLPQNLADVAVSSTSILTLASGVNGSTASLMRTDGARATTEFSSPLSSLRVSFAGKSAYLATTKPSAALPGAAFLVNTAGRFSRIAGPLSGLVALSNHSGKWVLISYSSGSVLRTALVNIATGEMLALPIATIADKCVWTSDDSAIYCGVPVDPPTDSTYPDDWYQGAVHFSDRVWKIQVVGRYAQLVLDFSKETGEQLDVELPAVDTLNTTLVFVNKNDGSLWSYSL